MLGNPGTYANKKRKKPVLKPKKMNDGNGVVKSNPSKRHRDRLNGELDRLMELLPFSEDVRSRLDKLSVLRLSVGYLRVKSHFKASIKTNSNPAIPGVNGQNRNNVDGSPLCEGDLLLQALNGFVIVVTSNGLVFYASHTIKDYLGFHQSDVVHQSVFDLIHTDDRATFREQLHFALNPPPLAEKDILQCVGNSETYNPDQLPPENSSFLERSFVCRFRCLLDNSSGFLALKFQGRLKYLHSQSFLNGSSGSNGNRQLGLFTIATPVQPPSIVEIRAKMLLFQTKHRLDFTPTGVDSRGKIVLGYSEIELCMKGSGYQFIHAADMMYCADNHIRMIKTGESGLTVFRLLTKSGTWQWVKSNAKLIFKGGRPEFIIAYQRALSNPEGEAYLCQRRLQLPFGFTTGEAVLYNTSPTMDVMQHQFNKLFGADNVKRNTATPTNLLDCFLSQDEAVYTQTTEASLPVDQVFMDSRALVSFPGNSWQEAAESIEDPAVVKEEAKQSVAAVIDSLEKIAGSGDFGSALESMDMDDAALMELENTIKGLSEDQGQQSSVMSDLDSLFTNDIFDYIDSVLFKEKGEDCMSSVAPSCLTGGKQNDFPMATQFPEVSEPPLFQTPSPGCTHPAMNGLYPHQHGAVNGGGVTEPRAVKSPPMFTQKLSHQGSLMPAVDRNLPPIQQLQLQDIFSPSIELPELTIPHNGASSVQSCRQPALRHMGVPPQVQQANQRLVHPNNLRTPAENGPLLQNSAQQPKMDILPPLIPSKDLSSPNVPIGFSVPCLQESLPFETRQSWPQTQQQQQQQQQPKLPHTNIVQNGHEKMLSFQISDRQTLPCAGFWPKSVTGPNHAQQQQQQLPAVPTAGQPAAQSSCMFGQPFSSGLAGGAVMAQSGLAGLRGGNPYQGQSPPQASRYFQWGHSEPVVGTSVISQDNVNISPLTTSPNHQLHMDTSRPMQNGGVTAEHPGYYVHPPQDVAQYLME